MCARKYMFGVYIWFKLEWSKHAQKKFKKQEKWVYYPLI